jgi:Arc/MetJ-type ribon-helix-helix transcriptional regulator
MNEVEELREQIESWVQPGFRSRPDVVQYAIEYAEDDGVLSEEQATQLGRRGVGAAAAGAAIVAGVHRR